MLWLASFPRSGNTFFRNVLHDVYGVESSTYHLDPNRRVDKNYAVFKVVKTHLLPGQLPVETSDWPAVYLVRDGRDSLVSIAHHRKDIVAPGTDFYNNLIEATLAQNGSFFGGWSENVRQWAERASIVIRFEDLIADPIREVEKLRQLIDLPPADPTKLPTFQSLREGEPAYGGGKGANFNPATNRKHFRKGKVGSWKEEVTPELGRLLEAVHGPMLRQYGYAPPLPSHPVSTAAPDNFEPKTVLVEASKMFTNDNDGIKRYLTGLDYGMAPFLPYFPHLKVALYYGNGVLVRQTDTQRADPVFRKLSRREEILQDRRTMGYEKVLLLAKNAVKTVVPDSVYTGLARHYERGPYRKYLAALKMSARKIGGRLSASDLDRLVGEADLIHVPLPQHFQRLPLGDAQLLVTVHDLTHRLFPDFHEDANVAFSEEGMTGSLRANAHFLSVSNATDADLARIYDVPRERRYVVPEAADVNQFNPGAARVDFTRVRERYGIPPAPYLFCLSTIEPRKNLRRTLEAFIGLKEELPELGASLVVGGKRGWKTADIFADLDLDRPDIILTGFVEDEHLPALYANARAFCFASLYEGFGLPLAEAMACGVPVIYGRNSAQIEVAGNGGLAVNAEDVADIRLAMKRLLTDNGLHGALSEAARKQSHRFNWLKTALLTLTAYEDILYRQP